MVSLFHWVSLNCKHGSVKGEDVGGGGEGLFLRVRNKRFQSLETVESSRH